jgi:hypothetical protein
MDNDAMAPAKLTLHDTCKADFRHSRLTPYALRPGQLDSLASRFDKSAGAGKRIIESCEKDDRALGKIGVFKETLSRRLVSRIMNPEEGDRVLIVRGIDLCPFEGCGTPEMQSAAITLLKPELGISLWISHLMMHLATEHGFFGYSPSGLPGMSRVAPLDIALMLGLTDRTAHMATTREIYGNEMAWKNGFLHIEETSYPILIRCPGSE